MSSSSRSFNPKGAILSVVGISSPSRIIGAGEMADLIREFDWERTPLGPVENWPDTLITTVNLLLASRHPMFLWWGPDLIQFYNDGYRPSLRGDKHPAAVGQRGLECWPEIWPIIGPQIEAVMERGDSTWNTNQLVPINRNGKLEEVFWTYSYSPVRDKDGAVQGTLVVCSETTEQVLSERRLRTLLAINVDPEGQDQLPESQRLPNFAHAIIKNLHEDPADLPFAALYLIAEGRILHSAGTPSTRVMAASQSPLLDAVNAQTPQLFEDLQQQFGDFVCQPWPEPVTCAYLLPLPMPGSSVQAALLLGISPRLPFDSSYRTFFNLIGTRIAALLQDEVHRQERAQAAERFRRLIEANPFGMVIGRLNGELKYVNPPFLKTLGYTQADVNSGKLRWDDLTPPEYAEADARAVQQLRTSGRCDVYEKSYIAKDGRRIAILLGASAIDAAGSDPEIAAFVTDLTPLKTAEEALRQANEELEKKVAERTAALEAEVLDRKRAEINLRELTGRLLLLQDEERRRMARELHDHAGQTLTALGMNLSAVQQRSAGQDPEIVGLTAESLQLSGDLSKELRTLSYLLHPPLLDENGIASALRWYVAGFSERSKIEVELDLPEDMGRLPRDLEMVVFRVVQESLTNIHRHSGSSSARIQLTCSKTGVELQVSDRGKGISPERKLEMTAARAGVGVRGMEERVRQLGGTLKISSDQKGTQVTASLPISPDVPGSGTLDGP
ncbi:MAG TPA: PAS domain S-box protein [Terriglobales bacterium]|jgi:PAS domain S-box-containing protein|nr:PAS domain S-box protein [Terriglobales bacterium]